MIFSLGENYFLDGGPVFIYPFADGKRFLCDYDDDTSMLDFVVDLGGSNKTAASFTKWPPNDNVMGNYVRTYITSQITNVVFEAKGLVRLPNYAELEEVSSYLNNPDQKSVTTVYFNFLFHKKFVLLDLATNRQSVWPVEK